MWCQSPITPKNREHQPQDSRSMEAGLACGIIKLSGLDVYESIQIFFRCDIVRRRTGSECHCCRSDDSNVFQRYCADLL